jgi:hypothetical protein
VVDGYVLMAGGLLLLGGRLADIFGRRKIFLIGVLLFAVASATCGAAVNPGLLVASRFVQGMGEALAAPASLGLIALLFADARERIKALGLWGGIAGLGGTLGVTFFEDRTRMVTNFTPEHDHPRHDGGHRCDHGDGGAHRPGRGGADGGRGVAGAGVDGEERVVDAAAAGGRGRRRCNGAATGPTGMMEVVQANPER